MQRSSVYMILFAFMLLLAGAAFTSKPLPPSLHTPAPAPTATRQALYYWYSWPYDDYNDRASVSAEIFEMWIYYDGVTINTSPAGGTLIERGYLNNAWPHNESPYYFLYAHFN